MDSTVKWTDNAIKILASTVIAMPFESLNISEAKILKLRL